MFVDKGYQEHEESNKEFNGSQKFPIYGSMLCQIFGQKSEAIHQLYSFFLFLCQCLSAGKKVYEIERFYLNSFSKKVLNNIGL
ncbi:hypothetical protein [Acinetobacter sp. V117_2]|uniref:hypothetical protein n=1 Tax=unclassified Acinetobacter TaxID=196816 RepID=UPI0021E59331|nr:hypothetical protein [Acinetobacter sp. V117_2]MDS7968831.1 hypothetical protein [Acinetobacter sp. V117_2]